MTSLLYHTFSDAACPTVWATCCTLLPKSELKVVIDFFLEDWLLIFSRIQQRQKSTDIATPPDIESTDFRELATPEFFFLDNVSLSPSTSPWICFFLEDLHMPKPLTSQLSKRLPGVFQDHQYLDTLLCWLGAEYPNSQLTSVRALALQTSRQTNSGTTP
jgi:hypothetical protein